MPKYKHGDQVRILQSGEIGHIYLTLPDSLYVVTMADKSKIKCFEHDLEFYKPNEEDVKITMSLSDFREAVGDAVLAFVGSLEVQLFGQVEVQDDE